MTRRFEIVAFFLFLAAGGSGSAWSASSAPMEIVLRDGSRISGDLIAPFVRFQTPYGPMAQPARSLLEYDAGTGRLILTDGDEIRATLEEDLDVRMASGPRRIAREQVASLRAAGRTGRERRRPKGRKTADSAAEQVVAARLGYASPSSSLKAAPGPSFGVSYLYAFGDSPSLGLGVELDRTAYGKGEESRNLGAYHRLEVRSLSLAFTGRLAFPLNPALGLYAEAGAGGHRWTASYTANGTFGPYSSEESGFGPVALVGAGLTGKTRLLAWSAGLRWRMLQLSEVWLFGKKIHSSLDLGAGLGLRWGGERQGSGGEQ